MLQKLVRSYIGFASSLKDIPPLLFRLTLAYGFFGPAYQKVTHFADTIKFFESIGIPAPEINAYMATATEVTGIVLVLFGLATRFIAVPMIVIMVVAIKTVHWANGFSCGDQGFEVPFYYMLMLLSLIVTGPGAISVDRLLEKRFSRSGS